MDAGGVAVIGALSGVLGAAVGAGGVIVAAAVSERRTAATQHRHWRRQLRRDAYAGLLSRALEKRSQIDRVQTAYQRGQEVEKSALSAAVDLDPLLQALTIVSLEGPEDADQAGITLVTGLNLRMGLLLLAWQGGPLGGADNPLRAEMEQREREANAALECFRVISRRLLD